MNKKDLVRLMADEAAIPYKVAEVAMESLINGILEAVATDSFVNITGLGSFTSSNKAPRLGLNPRTREPVFVPPQRLVKFKAAKAFKEKINEFPVAWEPESIRDEDLNEALIKYLREQVGRSVSRQDSREVDPTENI